MKLPPARIDKVIYEEWIKESPKIIEGGVLELMLCNGYSKDDDAWNLDARKVHSNVLDSVHGKNLYIIGIHDRFEGFKIFVNTKDKYNRVKFLLMGHQHHPGPFLTDDGIDLGDHPHFHKIKHYKRKYTGERMVGRTHEFSSPLLFVGMDAEQFLRAFLKSYYFDHIEKNEIKKIIGKQFQSELGKFNNRTEDD